MARLKRILMVVTNSGHLDAQHPTGVWFEEFAIPYQEFRANGFEVTVASPQGGPAPIDPRSEPGPEQAREATEARIPSSSPAGTAPCLTSQATFPCKIPCAALWSKAN